MNIKPRLKNKLQPAYRKTLSGFKKAMPSIAGVLLLIGLIQQVDLAKIQVIFTGNFFFDTFFGALVGSVAAGNPITSYIIGGELLSKGVSMFAVTAFILAWVTVGIVSDVILDYKVIWSVVALVAKSIIVSVVSAKLAYKWTLKHYYICGDR